MINLIKTYFKELSESDDKTIHSHTLTMSIVLSVIIMSAVIAFFGRDIFDIDKFEKFKSDTSTEKKDDVQSVYAVSTTSDIKTSSPLELIRNVWRDVGSDFSKSSSSTLGTINEVKDILNKAGEEKNINSGDSATSVSRKNE